MADFGADAPVEADRARGPIRVLVVDDHHMFASSLAKALHAEPDLLVVGQAASLEDTRVLLASEAPDVVLLDHRLPDGDGVASLSLLRTVRPSAQFVILTATTSERVLVAAMEAGAAGFMTKTQQLDEVIAGVRAAAHGESVVSPALLAKLLPQLSRRASTSSGTLTDRERDILDLLAHGLSNADIAARMSLSVHTVRNHVANLSAKLGAHSKLEALAIAVRDGLVDVG